jgi:hypothetical protein
MAWHSSTFVHDGLPLTGLLFEGGDTPLTNELADKGKHKATVLTADPKKVLLLFDSACKLVSVNSFCLLMELWLVQHETELNIMAGRRGCRNRIAQISQQGRLSEAPRCNLVSEGLEVK